MKPGTTESNEKNPESDGRALAYIAQINAYEKDFKDFEERGKKIIKRFRDERTNAGNGNGKRRYNMLYANVDLLKPALYAQAPKPQCERRFRDADKVGRVASEVLERVLLALLDNDETGFDTAIQACVEDRLLPGRGQVWLRYVPTFKDIKSTLKPLSDGATGHELKDGEKSEPERDTVGQQVATETLVVDYVHWTDFGHEVARKWGEVGMAWKRVFMSRTELVDRFGEELGKTIPLDSCLDDKKPNEATDKACIYEIVDRNARKTLWISKTLDDQVLDELDNPLQLEQVYPFPKPLYATMTNDSLLPVPDFVYYQDQLQELDDLTERIRSLTKALKVAGVYDASSKGVKDLLDAGIENRLVPVENWAIFADKGGIKGAIDWLPIEQIAAVIERLVAQRDLVLQQIYELTGLSDIVRGVTAPSETLGAQKLKSNYATLRLEVKQKQVAVFARDTLRLMAEMVCNLFQDETIKEMANLPLMTQAEKTRIQAGLEKMQAEAQAIQAAGGQPPPIPPLPEEVQEQLDKPSWEEVLDLLRDDVRRQFRIDVETDSTVAVDYEQEKRDRTEYIGAITKFFAGALPALTAMPSIGPVVSALLLWGSRAFKGSRALEFELEQWASEVTKAAKQPPPQPPGPPPDNSIEVEKVKQSAENERTAAKLEIDKAKVQIEAARLKKELIESAATTEGAVGESTMNRDSVAAQTDAVLQILAQQGEQMQQVMAGMAQVVEQVATVVQGPAQDANNSQQAMAQAMAMMAAALDKMNAPKRVLYQDGRPVGVETVGIEQ